MSTPTDGRVEPREWWPCGCVKGKTPHGAGWADCEFAKTRAEHVLSLGAAQAASTRHDGPTEASDEGLSDAPCGKVDA